MTATYLAPVPTGTNNLVTTPPREPTLCLCERRRGDLGCNCGDLLPPLGERIAAIFAEFRADLAALRAEFA